MTAVSGSTDAAPGGLNGWVEAGIFAVALAILNVTYAYAFQLGAHAVVFVGYAVVFASVTLLLVTGPGPDWRRIISHPLSFGIGGGIIAMESTYYMLMAYATPADASLLVRLNVPVSALLGYLLIGRKCPFVAVLGHLVVVAAIAWYVPALQPDGRVMAVALGIACGFIMTARWFATEFHPWNRAARSIWEKMRLTGLVLLVTSLMALALVGALLAFVGYGMLQGGPWLPRPREFLHAPTILVSAFAGAFVITTMQYFGFSTVVKIRSENFVATTALIPLVTVAFQVAAVRLGILAPIPLDWSVVPSMLVVFLGVLIVIWASNRAPSA